MQTVRDVLCMSRAELGGERGRLCVLLIEIFIKA